MMQLAFHRDPRSRRTQAAILEAFVRLLAERRYDAVTVADLVAAARVGKATFYEHYRGKHDVLLAAMEPILLALSTAASGRAARSYVKGVVAHLWDRRATARGILGSTAGSVVQRRLAKLILPHAERSTRGGAPLIIATGVAAAQIAMLRSWLGGEECCTTDEMTDRMIDCSNLIMEQPRAPASS